MYFIPKYFSINQCNNFYRIIKEEEKWIGAGITSILWSSLVHFCSFLLTLLTLLLLKIQEEKSLGFKRYLNQQAIILNYLYNYCIYCGFLQIHQGHLTFVHPISLTFLKRVKQMNPLLLLNHNQRLNKRLSGATRWIFCTKPLKKINWRFRILSTFLF